MSLGRGKYWGPHFSFSSLAIALEFSVLRAPLTLIFVWYTWTYQQPTLRGLHGVVGLPLRTTAKRWGRGVVLVSFLLSLKRVTPFVVKVVFPHAVLKSWIRSL